MQCRLRPHRAKRMDPLGADRKSRTEFELCVTWAARDSFSRLDDCKSGGAQYLSAVTAVLAKANVPIENTASGFVALSHGGM